MADFSSFVSAFLNFTQNVANIATTLSKGLPQISLPVTTANGGTGTANGVPAPLGFSTASGATVATNTTIYLGNFGANATENTVAMPLPFPCTVRNLVVVASAAPGAAQTFTYTLRKNGVAQAVTTSLSGASQTTNSDTTHSVSYGAGDTIDVQLVTSNGAAVAAHLVSVEVDKNP
jgi:hypothetical protein